MLYLHMQDVVANAIIELNQINGSRNVSMNQIEKYGAELIDYFRNLGYYTNIKSSKEAISYFEKNCADFFQKYQRDGETGYSLQKDKTIIDLIDKFRKGLEAEVLLAFTNQSVIKVLLPKSVDNKFYKLQNSGSQIPMVELLPNSHPKVFSHEKQINIPTDDSFIEILSEDWRKTTKIREKTLKKSLL